MKKHLIKAKYWWYYGWGDLACKLANSRWEWKADIFYPLYNRWMTKASDISIDNDLGYWTEEEHKEEQEEQE